MKEPIIKAVDLIGGRMCLSTANVKQIRGEQGSMNIKHIRNATQEDVEWVRAMGGEVPEGKIAA